MKNKLYFYIFIISVIFSSCCSTSDSTVSNGYPFNGDAMELKFTVHSKTSPNQISRQFLDSIRYIKDSSEFRKVFNREPDIDMNLYSLVYVSGQVRQVFEFNFQKRVLINHKAKTYLVELRAYTKTCSSGLSSNYTDHFVFEFLTVPKVPDGYYMTFRRFPPVLPN
jgi:hypothetical protein